MLRSRHLTPCAVWAVSTAVLLSFSAVLVAAQDSDYYVGSFINPPQRFSDTPQPNTNPIYAVGGVLNITWTANASEISVTIWQSVNDGGTLNVTSGYLPNSKAIVGQDYFTWDPIQVNGYNNNPYFDLAVSNMFHLNIYAYPSGLSALSQSIWFNITNATVNAQGDVISTASASASSTASASASLHSVAPASASATSTSLSTQPVSSGLSSSAKVGIGLGVGLVVPLLAALIAGVVIVSRRRKAQHSSGSGPAYSAVHDNETDTAIRLHEKDPAAIPYHQYPSELPAQNQGYSQQHRGELEAIPSRHGPAELSSERLN